MQRNLSSGEIGRVLVDRNTAFHFLDKSGLKRNRQIRLIRNIDYPMDYFLAFTKRDSSPLEIAGCGPTLKELTGDLVSVAKSTAQERLIPAQLQVIYFLSLLLSFLYYYYSPFFQLKLIRSILTRPLYIIVSPLKCSVAPTKVTNMLDNAHHTESFFTVLKQHRMIIYTAMLRRNLSVFKKC